MNAYSEIMVDVIATGGAVATVGYVTSFIVGLVRAFRGK